MATNGELMVSMLHGEKPHEREWRLRETFAVLSFCQDHVL